MPRKAPALKPAEPAAPKQRVVRDLLAHDSYVDCLVVDATLRGTRAGEPRMTLQLEVTKPRAYAGRTLYFSTQPSMTETQANLDARFPGIDWTDEDSVWDALGSTVVRAHVYIQPEEVDANTSRIYPRRNRVTGLWEPLPPRDQEPKVGQTDARQEGPVADA